MEKGEIHLKTTPASVKPLFADEVAIAVGLKASKDKDEQGKIRKEGHVRFTFIDTLRGQPVADVVITPMTAENLVKILGTNLDVLNKELKSNEFPKVLEIKKATTSAPEYIG